MKLTETEMVLQVRLKVPTKNQAIVAAYVREAIQNWKGGMDPEAEMFDLDAGSVRVFVKEVTTKTVYTSRTGDDK